MKTSIRKKVSQSHHDQGGRRLAGIYPETSHGDQRGLDLLLGMVLRFLVVPDGRRQAAPMLLLLTLGHCRG